jgi:hypothetical protein
MMKPLWPGWLLCVLTAGLFVYMAMFEAVDISRKLDGLKVPDAVITGYNLQESEALHAAFATDQAAADIEGRQSASAAYVSMHAGSDLLFPPMMAASLVFLAVAALASPHNRSGTPRSLRIGLGLVLALAFAYLGCDYVENAVADAMFGPASLDFELNAGLVPVLRGLTAGKYLCLAVALMLIAALWINRWVQRPPASSAAR